MSAQDCPLDRLHEDLARRGVSLLTDLDSSRAEGVLAELGTLLPQDHGQVRYDVKPTPQGAGLSSSKSANPLNPHTEASNYPQPPRLIALWCAHAARCGGGQTLVSDGFRMLSRLSEHDLKTATQEQIAFSDPSRPATCLAPVLTISPVPMLRFSYTLLRHGCYDPETTRITKPNLPRTDRQRLADQLLTLFDECHEAIDIPDGGLLVVDNRRMIHSRTGFTDYDRHLIRYWLQ